MGSMFAVDWIRRSRALGVVLVATCLLAGFGAPPTLYAQDVLPADSDETASRRTTFSASQDSYVLQSSADSNFGTEDQLVIIRGGSLESLFANPLLQFDLTNFPVYTSIESASLRLHQISGGGDTQPWTIATARAIAPWSESSVTFNNRPGATTTPPTFDAPTGDDEIIEFDVTPIVGEWVSGVSPNYGMYLAASSSTIRSRTFSSREAANARNRPLLTVDYTLPPVRVCVNQNDTCPPASGAIVHNVTTGAQYVADANGYLSAASVGDIALGDMLWSRQAVESANGGTRYILQDAPVAAVQANYMYVNDAQELWLVVGEHDSLFVQDIDVSAQWHVQGNPALATRIANRFIAASNYLYAFTDGQFALGTVRIYQNYDEWDDADMQMHAHNTLRPRAFIGGVTPTTIADFDASLPVTYTNGPISMGSYWNRFGTPPNSTNLADGVPVTELQMVNDWPLALAHELGHWLLYLFDTYTGIDGNASVELALQCVGTAMGNVYDPANHGFIAYPTEWQENCGETEAFGRLNGRTEWATIAGWYHWVSQPESFMPGPDAPPVQITQVQYIAPSVTPGAAAAQLFDLEYQNNENSSGEARAFLLRNDHIIEQGKPAKGTTQVQLTGAEVGDRLCVYDINDHAEGSEVPRHQFGCEVIVAGDSTLALTRDTAWSPQIALNQLSANQLEVVVTATIAGAAADQLFVRIFPEHDAAIDAVLLPRTDNVYGTVITLAEAVPPLFAQVYIDETPTAPQTRREIIADRGTGGGGAFGPARLYGDVLVMSSDGNASFEGEGGIELEAGESIAWQSMPGTPPIPYALQILGQSYRLDAFPAELVDEGTVRIRFVDPTAPVGAAGSITASSAGGDASASIWYWNGTGWSELATSVVTPVNAVDGVRLASAPSQGTGVYAVMMPDDGGSHRFLPVIER